MTPQPLPACRSAEQDPTSALVQLLENRCVVRLKRATGPTLIDMAISQRSSQVVRLVRSCTVLHVDQSVRCAFVKPRWRRRPMLVSIDRVIAAWVH